MQAEHIGWVKDLGLPAASAVAMFYLLMKQSQSHKEEAVQLVRKHGEEVEALRIHHANQLEQLLADGQNMTKQVLAVVQENSRLTGALVEKLNGVALTATPFTHKP